MAANRIGNTQVLTFIFNYLMCYYKISRWLSIYYIVSLLQIYQMYQWNGVQQYQSIDNCENVVFRCLFNFGNCMDPSIWRSHSTVSSFHTRLHEKKKTLIISSCTMIHQLLKRYQARQLVAIYFPVNISGRKTTRTNVIVLPKQYQDHTLPAHDI